MGGTAVAAPIDATGALFWNPATTSVLPSSLDFNVELLQPQSSISSSLPAGSLGPGIPAAGMSGSDRGHNGVFPAPAMALVFHPDDSALTFGLGVFSIGGFGVNYPASSTNPILTPQPPNGVGLGALFSQLQLIQIAPTVSLQLTDRLSIGGGPTVTMADLQADPLFVVSPDANGAYPSGTHTHFTWGGGFQVGAFYKLDGGWNLGASFKSPQWFNNFDFQATDDKGRPLPSSFRFDLPLIASVGVGYTGFDRWLLAADFRYIDYGNATGFHQSGFDSTGALQGLGWHSIFAMSTGAQYRVTDAVSVRVGYSYNQNPIPDNQASANVVSPLILEHTVYVGASYRVTDSFLLSLAYLHGFQNSIQGPLVTSLGTVAGSSVQTSASLDAVVLGATVFFGSKGCTTSRN
jgi:long-chain fatty acid transport protein